jgi:hypothetical protein
MPFGFTWGLVLLKDLPKTTNTVQDLNEKIYFENGFQCLFGLTRRASAIERLT